MIKNLKKRRGFWDQPQNRGPIDGGHDLKDSLPYPFSGYEYLFEERSVLEIGPGRGRQYDYLKDFVKDYSICDISTEALFDKCFTLVQRKFLITNYKLDFDIRFDLIHFWYVLHHVLEEELDEFFDFVYRHLVSKGIVLFNTPQLQNEMSAYPGDGIGTTHLTFLKIMESMCDEFIIKVIVPLNKKSTGCLIIGEKK